MGAIQGAINQGLTTLGALAGIGKNIAQERETQKALVANEKAHAEAVNKAQAQYDEAILAANKLETAYNQHKETIENRMQGARSELTPEMMQRAEKQLEKEKMIKELAKTKAMLKLRELRMLSSEGGNK